ncbi:MAG: PKD domain-containing protein, partial [Thermoplasmata archaeon]
PALYQILRNGSYDSDFHDITEGWNGYSTGTGWDPVTGLGTPIVANLLPSLAAAAPERSNLTVSVTADRIAGLAPLPVHLTAVGAGGLGTYTYDFVFGDGNATLTPLPSAEHLYRTAGVYNATVLLLDRSGNWSLAIPVVIVVGGGGPLIVVLSTSSDAAAVGGTLTFSVRATGGIGPYRYWIWFGDGTSSVPGSSDSSLHAFGASGGFCAWAMASDAADPIDGGGSAPVSIDIGSAPRTLCGAGAPISANLTSPRLSADLPGDLPLDWNVSGGSGALSAWIDAGDPYATACQCGIFRTAGPHEITLYANDSLGLVTTRTINVTLFPEITGSFSASTLSGEAPLSVSFSAIVSGGLNASAGGTLWNFGDGSSVTGSAVAHTFAVPGEYLTTADVADGGGGNASSAFLIDVTTPGESALGLTATISPAFRSPMGAPVAFRASAVGGSGSDQFRWELSDGSSAFGARFNESPTLAGCPDPSTCPLDLSLTVEDSAGDTLTAPISLAEFFGERSSALDLQSLPGPTNGTTPLRWSAELNASGMPGSFVSWNFGDGALGSGSPAQHTYLTPGNYTVTAAVGDAAGDEWIRTEAVAVNGSQILPLSVAVSPENFTCFAPCLWNFSARTSGGALAPFNVTWSFGGTEEVGPSALFFFDTPGRIPIWVNATDGLGQRASTEAFAMIYATASVDLSLILLASSVPAGGIFHLSVRYSLDCPAEAPPHCAGAIVPLLLEVIPSSPNGSALYTKSVPAAPANTTVEMDYPAPPLQGTFWFAVVAPGPAFQGVAKLPATVTAPPASSARAEAVGLLAL